MKKLLALLMVLVLSIGVLAGCTPKPAETPAPAPAPAETPAPAPAEPAASKIAKLGLGQNISIAKSKDKGVAADGKEVLATAQADVTIAAVGFDADGKVASVTIDVAQTKVAFDADMKVTSDKGAEVKSKKDLGPDYGMAKASGIGKEWFEQMGAFEEWMIGKTVEEIAGMKMAEGKTTEEDLVSSVTITVESYIAAVEEAWANAVDATGAETVGLGIETHINKSRDAGKDAEGKDITAQAQVDTYMSATAFDKDGKVVATIIDNAQVRIPYDAEGKVTADKAAAGKTKQELGPDYGMIKASGIGKEWFEQMGALQAWMAGKTVAEIMGMKVVEKDATHPSVPDVAELTSSVTISVEGYQAVVEEAFDMAR
jgi:hypothetical protein